MKRIKVLIVDDSEVIREAVRMFLEIEEDLELVGEATDGIQATDMVVKLRPEVVLMDIHMPRLDGLEATRRVLEAVPETKVIMFSLHFEQASVAEAINAGAMGYLLKSTCAKRVCVAIREVQKGNTFFSPSIPKSFLQGAD